MADERGITIEENDKKQISKKMEGYLPVDIAQIFDRIIHLYYSSLDPASLKFIDLFKKATESFTPSSLKSIQFATSNKSWDDIGALEDVKHTLKETFEWPTKYEKIFSKIPLKLRRGFVSSTRSISQILTLSP